MSKLRTALVVVLVVLLVFINLFIGMFVEKERLRQETTEQHPIYDENDKSTWWYEESSMYGEGNWRDASRAGQEENY